MAAYLKFDYLFSDYRFPAKNESTMDANRSIIND